MSRIVAANSLVMPRAIYRKAQDLYRAERYLEGCAVLEFGINNATASLINDGITLGAPLGLYALCCAIASNEDGLQSVRSLVAEQSIPVDGDLQIAFLWAAVRRAEWEQVYQSTNDALAVEQTIGFRHAGFLRFFRAYANANLGQTAAAVEDAEIARALFVVAEEGAFSAQAANYLGLLYRQTSFFRMSLVWYDRALKYYTQHGLLDKQAMVQFNRAVTNYKTGDYDAAHEG
ncbi:MAG TPA: hypothetical protein PLQ13_05840, partial [Candidatus Krumholzibacteria bacterium]|nr:hypothetical protein [Candidatus Krumholzibacteria bacterium]